MSEFLKRIIVGAVGIPIAVGIIYLGGYLFLGVIIVVSTLAMHEFYKLAEKKGTFPAKWISIIFGAVFLFVTYEILAKAETGSVYNTVLIYPALMIIYVLVILICQLFRRKKSQPLLSVSVAIMGLMYISVSFMFLIGVRYFGHSLELFAGNEINSAKQWTSVINDKWSAWLLISVFATVWICDTAAYFIGKMLGKHKLMEKVSPKKTWEGAIAGFVFAIISFVACSYLLIHGLPLVHAIVAGVIVGTIGQIGDLAESQLKRDSAVKDSSNLLPGHGGALDRFDSILFVMPVVYIYMLLAAFYL